jgi:hypothetical protein
MSYKILKSKKLNSLMEQLMECDMSYVDAFLKKNASYYDETGSDSVGAFRAGYNLAIWNHIRDLPFYQVEANDLYAFFEGSSIKIAKLFTIAIAKWQKQTGK